MVSIAIFASGSGTNAENLMRVFHSGDEIRVKKIYTNHPEAGVIQRAEKFHVPFGIYSNEQFKSGEAIIADLKSLDIEFIILAGFLRLITPPFLEAFPQRIINIHPSLLPKYGGKGMYGMKVHEAVVHNRETQSGITIHVVDEHYDRGKMLGQFACRVNVSDTPELLAARIHELEYKHFPDVVRDYCLKNKKH